MVIIYRCRWDFILYRETGNFWKKATNLEFGIFYAVIPAIAAIAFFKDFTLGLDRVALTVLGYLLGEVRS
jgi:hypothetical protein